MSRSLCKSEALRAALDGRVIRHSSWHPNATARWDAETGVFRDQAGQRFNLDDFRTISGWEVVINQEQELLEAAVNQLHGIAVFLGHNVGISAIGRYLCYRQLALAKDVAGNPGQGPT